MDRPVFGRRASSSRSLVDPDDLDDDEFPTQDRDEEFTTKAIELLCGEEVRKMCPSKEDYKEAFGTLITDSTTAFLSLLAVLDILFQPLMMLVVMGLKFAISWLMSSATRHWSQEVKVQQQEQHHTSKTARIKRRKSQQKLLSGAEDTDITS